MVWVDPRGDVSLCYGILLGNLADDTIEGILDRFATSPHPLLAKLDERGPIALYEAARDAGAAPGPESFGSECALCYASRSALRPRYPEIFGPPEAYFT